MATSPRTKKTFEIPGSLLQNLKEHVVTRQVSNGIALLNANAQLFHSLDPAQPNAAGFVGYVAQWVDIGYRDPKLLQQLLERFPSALKSKLPVCDYLKLRMAEGLYALLRDEPDVALFHFDLVLSMHNEIEDKELVAIAHFWNARCHRKKGAYDAALKHTLLGRELAGSLGFDRMAAVMRVLESWLHFQKGNRREATRILEKAEQVLRDTDDDITLGNIYSAHGRMIRRQGRYNEALKFFSKAIEHYHKRNSQHRNLARSLTNIAYVQRLAAIQISKQIDADSAKRRKAGAPSGTGASGRKKSHWEQYEQLRAEAFANLEQAEKIYRHHNHHHGIGSIYENRGLLYLDIGDLDNASTQAALAYSVGKEESDSILMARARLLQCTIENAKLEEEIEGSAHSWEHVQTARDYAREAVEAARQTQNQRLLARAYIWRGLIACSSNDIEDAKHCCDMASSFLKSVDYDDLWEELQLLKQKVVPKGNIDPLLRSWSQGITGEKSFQQMTEQFAELVIPRVWEKEGKKISRVATRLSISPKKVRRILAHLGKIGNKGQ
ncbi:MAG TPA: tetratricopeptide repeat protein [Candidatus Angelobacter sp.]|nr:tetratricopeptide repeat protein [Candidatus Angelobacter sp.]